ncbi:MAG: tetratricopeptide repeat protein [Cyclobacteriaceae bacterium]|nr:tetratricopeptide repeat protein [Cyclobacteriaceae bacterium]
MKLPIILQVWLCALLWGFYTIPAQCQDQNKVDSMKQLLRGSIADTARIDTYANLSWVYANTHTKLDTARLYADSMVIWSKRINYPKGVARAQGYYALLNKFSGDYYASLGHMQTYLEYYQSKRDSNRIAYALYEIGNYHFFLGNYPQSLQAYQQVLGIYKNSASIGEIARCLHAMGHVQRRINKYEAIKSYEEAMELWEEAGDQEGLSMSTEGIGNTYEELGQYDQAEMYLLKALDMVEDQQRPIGIASVATNLGVLYSKLNQHQKALDYHLRALKVREELTSQDDLALSLNKVGASYMALGASKLAEVYLKASLDMSQEIQVKPLLKENYSALTALYKSQNRIEEAFHFQNLLMVVKDSLLNEETNKQLVEMETKYEVARKDQEITLLLKENEVQEAKVQRQAVFRNALIGAILLVAIIAVLIFYVMRQRLKNQKIINAKNEEIQLAHLKEELKSLEMKALRAQMNPHFLFNSLNTINTMILKNDKRSASRYLTKFSKLVRLILENSEQPKVSLKDELDMLTAYIQLESIRFEDKMDYNIQVAETIDPEVIKLPSMVLQPFVENAIWHGLLHQKGKGQLSIDIAEKGEYLRCSIIDNGVGREESKKVRDQKGYKKRSMGIKITGERLKLLTQQTVKELIDIVDLKDPDNRPLGTQVNVLIPTI